MALVGSYARGAVRHGSDIDIVLLVGDPATFRSDATWPGAIDWTGAGKYCPRWRDEDYGVVWSRRIRVAPGIDVEISFAPLSWTATAPVDAGTRRVVRDGCGILFDPDGHLTRLVEAIRQERPTGDLE
jgi:uncharacterized protein